jgi:hypothetical protein
MVMMQNFEVILGQTLNHSVEFCYFMQVIYFYLMFLKREGVAYEITSICMSSLITFEPISRFL